MSPAPRPIFLFSLPRSGSTLLQRMLAAHCAIATASEPWVLLPLLETPSATRSPGVSDHDDYLAARAEFGRSLNGGVDAYRTAVRNFAAELYAAASPAGTTYFLDKTPRYHRIAREIVSSFPDARFVFLWRQPLAVAASMMSTWADGRWNLYRFDEDLRDGLARLASLARELGDGRAVALKYEDLLQDPGKELRRVLDYLQLPFDPDLLAGFANVRLQGSYGDPTGTVRYATVSTEPLDKWKAGFGNPLRRTWARRYLASIDARDLQFMGYSREQLSRDLEAAPLGLDRLLSDAVRMMAGRHWRGLSELAAAHRERSAVARKDGT